VQLSQLLLTPVVSADCLLLQCLQLVAQTDELLLLGDHPLLEGERGVAGEVETLLEREQVPVRVLFRLEDR
jgi:hypothetical protein